MVYNPLSSTPSAAFPSEVKVSHLGWVGWIGCSLLPRHLTLPLGMPLLAELVRLPPEAWVENT